MAGNISDHAIAVLPLALFFLPLAVYYTLSVPQRMMLLCVDEKDACAHDKCYFRRGIDFHLIIMHVEDIPNWLCMHAKTPIFIGQFLNTKTSLFVVRREYTRD